MNLEIRVPDLGLAPETPIRVSHWYADVQETLLPGDRLVELVVPGAVYEVPCPAEGVLDRIAVRPWTLVAPGQLLAVLKLPTPPGGDPAAQPGEPPP